MYKILEGLEKQAWKFKTKVLPLVNDTSRRDSDTALALLPVLSGNWTTLPQFQPLTARTVREAYPTSSKFMWPMPSYKKTRKAISVLVMTKDSASKGKGFSKS